MGLSQVALQRMNMVMCIVYAEVLIMTVILLTMVLVWCFVSVVHVRRCQVPVRCFHLFYTSFALVAVEEVEPIVLIKIVCLILR